MAPTLDTIAPTRDPTMIPTDFPTWQPTPDPSAPSNNPTKRPTVDPSANPSEIPTKAPSQNPTKSLTDIPTKPTVDPTISTNIDDQLISERDAMGTTGTMIGIILAVLIIIFIIGFIIYLRKRKKTSVVENKLFGHVQDSQAKVLDSPTATVNNGDGVMMVATVSSDDGGQSPVGAQTTSPDFADNTNDDGGNEMKDEDKKVETGNMLNIPSSNGMQRPSGTLVDAMGLDQGDLQRDVDDDELNDDNNLSVPVAGSGRPSIPTFAPPTTTVLKMQPS